MSESPLGAPREVRSYRVDGEAGSRVASKAISGLLWLVLGLLIGAFGYYFYSQYGGGASTPAQPVEAALLSFEQQRRLVDSDPASYLSANAAKADKSAAENYLVGRAYLLQKNYGAAKTAFEDAKQGLSSVADRNRTVLENDIDAGMAIVANEDAQKSFEGAPEDGAVEPADSQPEPKG